MEFKQSTSDNDRLNLVINTDVTASFSEGESDLTSLSESDFDEVEITTQAPESPDDCLLPPTANSQLPTEDPTPTQSLPPLDAPGHYVFTFEQLCSYCNHEANRHEADQELHKEHQPNTSSLLCSLLTLFWAYRRQTTVGHDITASLELHHRRLKRIAGNAEDFAAFIAVPKLQRIQRTILDLAREVEGCAYHTFHDRRNAQSVVEDADKISRVIYQALVEGGLPARIGHLLYKKRLATLAEDKPEPIPNRWDLTNTQWQAESLAPLDNLPRAI